MNFEIIGELRVIETIASGRGIRVLERLNREHGKGNWRKLKGLATVRLADGTIAEAELHWFEAHGIGRKNLKIKRLL
ncbi:MAG: hypothetical protein ACSLFQ_23090 [Thermoanaerobaculia bacterium]